MPLLGSFPLDMVALFSGDLTAFQKAVLAQNPIAFYPMNEGSGTVANDLSGNGYHGVYSGITWGTSNSKHGEPAPFFDGVAAHLNFYRAAFAAVFDMDEYTTLTEIKVFNAGVWTDAVARRIIRMRRDASNEVQIRRQPANATIRWFREGDNTVKDVDSGGFSSTDWIDVGQSVSIGGGGLLTAGDIRAYKNASQIGATIVGNIASTGSGLSTTQTVIGAATTSNVTVWHGWISNVAIFDVPITQAILDLQGLT